MEQDLSLMVIRILLDRGKISEIKKIVELMSNEVDREILKKVIEIGVADINVLKSVLKSVSPVDIKVDKDIWEKRLEEIEKCQIDNEDRKVVMDAVEKEWKRKRYFRLTDLCEKVLKNVDRESELSQEVRWIISDVERGLFEKEGITDKGILDRVLERYWRREFEKEECMLLGINTLDMIMGGLRRGTLSVILAGTSMGKTSFMVYLAGIGMLQGYNVLYVTLEDLKEVIEERTDKLLFGMTSNDEFVKKIKVLKGIGANVYIVYASDIVVRDVEKILEKYKESGINIDVLIIDYGDLLRTEKKQDEFIEIGKIFQELLRIAIDKKIWVISGSQAVRSAMNTRVLGLEHTSRSFRKVEVAHYVFGLMAGKDEETRNQVRVSVLKNKFGVKGVSVSCEVDWSRCLFKEMASD